MVQGPETKSVIFVRCLKEEVRVVVPGADGDEEEEEDEDDGFGGGGRDEMRKKEREAGTRMRRGEVWVVRWEGVKEAWRKGEVEVL